MGIISTLFGNSKNVSKGMDMVKSGVDMAFFTAEEKSLAGMEWLKLQIEMTKALGPSNIARRVIALTVTGLWAYHVLLAGHLYLFGYEEKAEFIFKVVKDVLTIPFVAIVGFYFVKRMIPSSK